MRKFKLVRTEDVSGVSGIGEVAQGIEFPDGQVVMQWCNTCSLCIYKNVEQVQRIHGHEGRTTVVFSG